MIRVLFVDDSTLVRTMLKKVFQEDGRFQVAGEACDGADAVRKAQEGNIDLIVMDINMPVMDGIEATRRISAFSPAAIVMFTTEDTMDSIYRSISAGALEVLQKPNIADMTEEMLRNFREKIYVISQSRKDKVQSFSANREAGPAGFPKEAERPGTGRMALPPSSGIPRRDYDILFIGSSTGGPSALQSLLLQLPKDFPLPIMITQHIDRLFDQQLVKWLNDTTPFKVSLARDGEVPERGHAYIAPADRHLVISMVGGRHVMLLNNDPPLHFLKPSVDKMFTSAAQVIADKVLAVILTGMGKDGAAGAVEIRRNGGSMLAQDEHSCIVFGMPKAVIEAGAAQEIVALDKMGEAIAAAVRA